MKSFPMPANDVTSSKHPIAILSGNLIHILHPNGEVEAIANDQKSRSKAKIDVDVDQYLVWGNIGYI